MKILLEADIVVLFNMICCRLDDIPAESPSFERLEKAELIALNEKARHPHTCAYNITERGRAHVIQLCNTLLPVSAWVDDAGNLLEETK